MERGSRSSEKKTKTKIILSFWYSLIVVLWLGFVFAVAPPCERVLKEEVLLFVVSISLGTTSEKSHTLSTCDPARSRSTIVAMCYCRRWNLCIEHFFLLFFFLYPITVKNFVSERCRIPTKLQCLRPSCAEAMKRAQIENIEIECNRKVNEPN